MTDTTDSTAQNHPEPPQAARVLSRLVAWAEADPAVRAMILTSSRARPDGPVDRFSDYDVIVGVTDAAAFADDLRWQSACGTPLMRWGDEGELLGRATFFRGVVYDDFSKVDYTVWPQELLDAVGDSALPPALDDGYRVLVDKDRRTARWRAPTHTAYRLRKPAAAEYRALVEQFWWDTTYVAKAVQRGELFFARSFVIEHDLKVVALCRMLEWRIAIDHDWAFAPGVYGRGLERHLAPDLRAALMATYRGADADDTWATLFGVIDLFRLVAADVADRLGYAYPAALDDRMTAYLSARRGPSARTR